MHIKKTHNLAVLRSASIHAKMHAAFPTLLLTCSQSYFFISNIRLSYYSMEILALETCQLHRLCQLRARYPCLRMYPLTVA